MYVSFHLGETSLKMETFFMTWANRWEICILVVGPHNYISKGSEVLSRVGYPLMESRLWCWWWWNKNTGWDLVECDEELRPERDETGGEWGGGSQQFTPKWKLTAAERKVCQHRKKITAKSGWFNWISKCPMSADDEGSEKKKERRGRRRSNE